MEETDSHGSLHIRCQATMYRITQDLICYPARSRHGGPVQVVSMPKARAPRVSPPPLPAPAGSGNYRCRRGIALAQAGAGMSEPAARAPRVYWCTRRYVRCQGGEEA